VCAANDAADCDAQCQKGDATSCDNLGSLIMKGQRGAPDPAAAAAAFQKACGGGSADGCGNLGTLLVFGPQRDTVTGMKALAAGCLGGSARACGAGGEAWMYGAAGTKDVVRALAFYRKGCEGGDLGSCTNAGFLYAGGGGDAIQRDDQRALAYEKRACFGGEPTACGNTGYKVELGEGVAANPPLAAALYARGCRLDPAVCVREGFLLETGAAGVPRDDAQAKAFLQRSCKVGGGIAPLGCVVLASVYGDSSSGSGGGGLGFIAREMKPQCDQQEGRACTFLGIAQFGQGQRPDGQAALAQGCSLKDPLGCELAAKMK
jgi:TPR repeat protein